MSLLVPPTVPLFPKFNQLIKYLLDGLLSIWDIQDEVVFGQIDLKSVCRQIKWSPNDESSLLAVLDNGEVQILDVSKKLLTLVKKQSEKNTKIVAADYNSNYVKKNKIKTNKICFLLSLD